MEFRMIGKALLLLALSALAAPVFASEIVIGAKAGVVNIDAKGVDPATIGSVQLGYEFLDLAVVDVATELELARSISDGESDAGDYSYSSKALYLSARTLGPIYVIGRAGIIDVEVDFDNAGKSDDNGVAYGVGVGFSTGIRVEIEVTRYEFDSSDTTTVTLGLHF